MQASDDTVRMVWHELVYTDRMCHYYSYLPRQLDRLRDPLPTRNGNPRVVLYGTLATCR